MIVFRSPLDTRAYTAGEFVLLADFRVEVHSETAGYLIAPPRGFITDFASVPKLVQALPGFDVNGNSRDAAVLHDYLYCCNGDLTVRDFDGGQLTTLSLSRQQCDRIFFDALLACGLSKKTASLFYAGVRAGGWYYWNKRSDGLQDHYDFVPGSYWSNPQ
jgi:hypothetical protein